MREEHELYGGNRILYFEPKRHTYLVASDEDPDNFVVVPGASSIPKVLDKSFPLMYWAKGEVLNFLRKVIEPGKAYDHDTLEGLFKSAFWADRQQKNKAADFGTIVHAYIEEAIKGRKVPKIVLGPELRTWIAKVSPKTNVDKNFVSKMNEAVAAFRSWWVKHKVKIIRPEAKIYSEKYEYAGTLDIEAMVDGKRCIVDIKCSSGIYIDHKLQTAGYQQAREEESGEEYAGRWIVRLDKKTGEVEARFFPTEEYQEFHFEAFLYAKGLYLAKQIDEQEEKGMGPKRKNYEWKGKKKGGKKSTKKKPPKKKPPKKRGGKKRSYA